MKKILFITLLVSSFLMGCANLFQGTITMTSVVDSAMKDWADLSVRGMTTPAFDAKVMAAHAKYQEACATAQKILVVYKESGDQADYLTAMQALREAADPLINLIVGIVAPTEGVKLQTNLAKATKL